MAVQTGPNELRIALESLRDALNVDIRPDLTSRQAKGKLEGSIFLLNRLIGELGAGNAVAAGQLSRWQDLRSRMHLSTAPDGVDLGLNHDLASLGNEMEAIQSHLADPARFAAMVGHLRNDDDESRAWFGDAAIATSDFLEAYEASTPLAAVKAAAEQHQGGHILPDLAAYLRGHYPDLPDDPIVGLQVVPGGRAKYTALFQLKPNRSLPERLVLRADTALGFTGTQVAAEYPVLREMHRRGLPVPEVVLAEPKPTAIGESFIIMREIEDAVGAGAPFPEERAMGGASAMGPDFGYELARFLARMHAVHIVPQAEDYGWTGGAPSPAEMIADYLAQYRALPRAPVFSIATDLGFAWLAAHPLSGPRPRGLVHGDFGAHNILTRDGHLVSVLDWELAHLGDPAEDIGYCRLMLLEDTIRWDDFVVAYIEAGGDPAACDPHAVSFYAIWSQVKNGVIGTRLRAGLQADPGPHDMDGVSGHWHFLPRIHQYLSRELVAALKTNR